MCAAAPSRWRRGRGRRCSRTRQGPARPEVHADSTGRSWAPRCQSPRPGPLPRGRRPRGEADEGDSAPFRTGGGGSHEAGRRGDGGGGLHLSTGQQVDKEGLVAGGGRLGRLTRRPLKLSADPGAAGIGGALRWRQEPENGPEAAGLGAFTVVGRGGPESEVRAVHRCPKPLAG